MRQRNRNQRGYAIRKNTIRDDFIDKQIVAIHRAMAAKVIQYPELIDKVLATLEKRRKEGRIGYGAYITWFSLLDIAKADPKAFYNGVIEDDKRMRKLRRNTPFVDILTEEERQNALEQDAVGTLPNIDFLL